MIVAMKPNATQDQLDEVCQHIRSKGYVPNVIQGGTSIIIRAELTKSAAKLDSLQLAPGVATISRNEKPYALVSRDMKPESTVVAVADLEIGSSLFVIMAGPCSVETPEQLFETACAVKNAGAHVLRGGAYKPRTSPYDFQGLGQEGLKLLAEARELTGLKIVTEILSPEDIDLVSRYADILQVGARNMQNFALLKRLGTAGRPVLLKRGMSSTIHELLLAAEYIAAHGNDQIVLCERGIRTFEPATRNTLDLAAVPVLKEMTHLPVIVDPSHGTGRRSLVKPMAKAAIASGADGLLIEVHPRPEEAWSDGPQSLTPLDFAEMVRELQGYAKLESRTLN